MSSSSLKSVPRRLSIDLTTQEPGHRREWEARLTAWAQDDVKLTENKEQADWVLRTSAPQLNQPRSNRAQQNVQPDGKNFVWDSGDHPEGRWPGLYASLPKSSFHPLLHRTFGYPLVYNEQIAPFDPADATHLLGFVGGITSGLRARIVDSLTRLARQDLLLQVTGGPWGAMFDRSGLTIKTSYAEALRKSKFFLCPRGNGVSSVRLFETMQAARVPVIVSDAYVLPDYINWNECAIIVAEKDLHQIHRRVKERESDWTRLARNARDTWEENYGDKKILRTIGQQLEIISASLTQFRGLQPLKQKGRLARARFEWSLRQFYFRWKTRS